MRKALWIALAAAAGTAQAAGTVDVSFVKPAEFSDVGRGQLEVEQNTQTIATFFKGLSAKLPAGQALKVEVLDFDLAGEIRPTRSTEIRIVRGGADWPSMRVRYTLTADGRTLASGEERYADMNYTFGIRPSQRDEPMGFDRRMVERWFNDRFEGATTAKR